MSLELSSGNSRSDWLFATVCLSHAFTFSFLALTIHHTPYTIHHTPYTTYYCCWCLCRLFSLECASVRPFFSFVFRLLSLFLFAIHCYAASFAMVMSMGMGMGMGMGMWMAMPMPISMLSYATGCVDATCATFDAAAAVAAAAGTVDE